MRISLLPASSQRTVPWKNGRGTTTELCSDAREPGGEWSWRLSVADVPEPAQFSEFAGVDRHILCVAGAGMRICIGGAWRDVPREGAALEFAGEASVRGEPLGQGVRDANLMVARSRWRGRLQLLRAHEHLQVGRAGSAGSLLLLHALAAGVACRLGGQRVALQLGETAVIVELESAIELEVLAGQPLAAIVAPG